MDGNLIKDLGTAGIIFVPFFFLLKWVLEEVSKILTRECDERKEWLKVIVLFQTTLALHNEQAKEFHDKVSKEHGQMIECLGRINGYKE